MQVILCDKCENALIMLFNLVTTNSHSHSHAHAHGESSHPHANPDGKSSERIRIGRLAMFLEAHFGEIEFHMPDADENDDDVGEDEHGASLLVRLDEAEAQISLVNLVCVNVSRAIVVIADGLRFRLSAVRMTF